MQKILLIEDDKVISQLVAKNLRNWSYEVEEVADFQDILSQIDRFQPHLILLDIGLPFFNGYYWCQEIRKTSRIPIMFLSSHDQPMDIVMAINMGADDYVTKPFEMTVLLAKIQGLLRRTYDFVGEQSLLWFGEISLDLKTMQVQYDHQLEELTKNEFQILRVLFEHGQEVVSREELMRQLWNSDIFVDDNTLSVNMARLRKKLDELGLPGLIATKKGVGYGLVWLLALGWDLLADVSRFGKYWRGQQAASGSPAERYLQEKVQQLEAQNKLLQEQQLQAKTELDDYYTLWAHQMKIPIAASQLLAKEIDQPDIRYQLENQLFKIEQYTGLVLNYLRLQSFHDDLVIERVDLEELVKSLIKKYSLFFIQARTKLDLGDLSRVLKTDKRWLGLLIEQVLSNALKYCENGTISIFLDGHDLVIRDTGLGIAESDLQRIFERGFSGFNGRRTQQSSGLGLYLSKKIAAELGYFLTLKSKLGQGTEVRIGIKETELALD